MSIQEQVDAAFQKPDPLDGISIQVVWIDATNHWAVWIGEHFLGEDGNTIHRDRLHRRYSPAECPTAYQALMAACSEWHNLG